MGLEVFKRVKYPKDKIYKTFHTRDYRYCGGFNLIRIDILMNRLKGTRT